MSRISRFFKDLQRSFFLFGPRGTGKSTLLESRYPKALRIDLLNAKTEREFTAQPERLIDLIQANPKANPIIIDEVQRVPQLLPVVHRLIFEKASSLQFILTGSSARKIKRDSKSDLLGGRASERHLHPFMAAELGAEFSLVEAVKHGMLPLIYQERDPQDVLQGYLSLYLKEEVKLEGLVRNLDNFTRFLEAVSFSHGSLLNVTNVAKDCAVNRKTVENYIEILEDLLLSYRLPIFQKQAKRRLVSHPKFYLFDTGVYQVLRPRGPLDVSTQVDGVALEGLVAQHLRAWCDYTTEKHTLYFWRTSAGNEVDFIVYGPMGLFAIEVKHGKQIRSNDVRGLKTFLEDYPVAKTLLVYQGEEKIMVNDVLCMPVGEFLLTLVPDQCIIRTAE